MDYDDIKLQEQLTDKQLAIFHAEMTRQNKSLTTSYLLLIFLGTLGIHKFYLGRIRSGIMYIIFFVFGWAITASGGLIAMVGTEDDIAAGGGMAIVGVLLLVALGLCLLWDLITLPRQFKAREKKVRQETLKKLAAE